MTVCKEKSDMYIKVADYFSRLSGYKESDQYYRECKELAEKTDKELQVATYHKALGIKNSAKQAEEYNKAAEEFKKISGYLDSDNIVFECNQLSQVAGRKAFRKRLAKFGLIILLIIALFVGVNTSHAKYYYANLRALTGSYNSAIIMYQKLGAYKDCEQRLKKSQYKKGLGLKNKGEYKDAVKALLAAGEFKDSETQLINLEKQMIRESKLGSTVTIGKSDWRVLDIVDGKALLMKNVSLSSDTYNNTTEDVTWEQSDLRGKLNTDFLETAFSETERKNIILTTVKNEDNEVYHSEGGNDTQDYIFLLSISEANKYKALFPKFQSNSWLRSPGCNQGSAAFLSVKGNVMDYGYEVTSNDFSVRPALWFSIE
jgi:tetratricopeptide (TPR) repeat protein